MNKRCSDNRSDNQKKHTSSSAIPMIVGTMNVPSPCILPLQTLAIFLQPYIPLDWHLSQDPKP